MDLRAIRDSFSLLWPEGYPNRFRGEAKRRKERILDGRATYVDVDSYVVDLDAPFERDVFCRGQEYKLRTLTEDEAKRIKKATPITDPVALAEIKRRTKVDEPPKPARVSKAMKAHAEGAAEWSTDAPEIASIPEPEKRTHHGHTKSHGGN